MCLLLYVSFLRRECIGHYTHPAGRRRACVELPEDRSIHKTAVSYLGIREELQQRIGNFWSSLFRTSPLKNIPGWPVSSGAGSCQRTAQSVQLFELYAGRSVSNGCILHIMSTLLKFKTVQKVSVRTTKYFILKTYSLNTLLPHFTPQRVDLWKNLKQLFAYLVKA